MQFPGSAESAQHKRGRAEDIPSSQTSEPDNEGPEKKKRSVISEPIRLKRNHHGADDDTEKCLY